MPTFKITLAYDGTEFVGWQRQAEGVSIQALVEEAADASFAAPEGFHELERRRYDDTEFVVLRRA